MFALQHLLNEGVNYKPHVRNDSGHDPHQFKKGLVWCGEVPLLSDL